MKIADVKRIMEQIQEVIISQKLEDHELERFKQSLNDIKKLFASAICIAGTLESFYNRELNQEEILDLHQALDHIKDEKNFSAELASYYQQTGVNDQHANPSP